jgi:hypothetical protein
LAAAVPTTEPTQITRGTTVRWTRSLADYLASDGWRLHYALAGPTPDTVACSATQTDLHLAELAATLASGATLPCTARMEPGRYYWQSYAASGAERFAIGAGEFDVIDSLFTRPTTGRTYDGRSTARRIVDAIDAILSGTANLAEASISVDGRSLSNRPLAELLTTRDKFARIVEQERKAAAVANGLDPENSIRVRFVAP